MKKKNNGLKKVLYIYGGVFLLLVITCITVYSVYNKKLAEAAKQSLLATEKLENIVPNNAIADVSKELSKGIEEAIMENAENAKKQIEEKVEETDEPEQVEATEAEPVEEIKPLEFIYPVEGEITKEFATEKLVFSETLQEWITHNGIDIKAERTAIVKATEDGTVTSIKNDPRYGLTVIIEHREGYKSIYSNLLTAEFVSEGDIIAKGQTLGTIGNSAIFEIADEPHLHFELLKDEENINPTLLLK